LPPIRASPDRGADEAGMVVRAGREFLAIPGPTTVPDEVLAAMHRPAIDIYSGELLGITDSLLADLARLFRTKGQPYIYIANGHGAWEAALTNVLSRGDRVLVLESGRFAKSWGEHAAKLGIEIEILKGDWRRAVRPAAVAARLRRDRAGTLKAVLAVHIDTASGVVNDIAAIGKSIRVARHDALFMVDAVASLGCVPFAMDAWGVDVTVSASQKGLMTPPGLSFIAAGPRARRAHQRAGLRTPYWDWTARDGKVHYMKYAGTAPEHLLFGLRRAMDMILAEGLDRVIHRHQLLAEAVRRAVAVWTQRGPLEFNIVKPAERSDTVTTILMSGRDPAPLLRYCSRQCGVVLGQGIGDLHGKAFRIAHMGHVNAPMVLGTLGVVEAALAALRIPHRKGGVQAAVDWLGAKVPA
jgi:alanine-glyoxylate transaminase/serine-glyoxylate transaminase/serine-pyruvate transaminase